MRGASCSKAVELPPLHARRRQVISSDEADIAHPRVDYIDSIKNFLSDCSSSYPISLKE